MCLETVLHTTASHHCSSLSLTSHRRNLMCDTVFEPFAELTPLLFFHLI
jgi:hypothetical protein